MSTINKPVLIVNGNPVADISQYAEDDSVSITADGTKTYTQLFNEFLGMIDISKLNSKSILVAGDASIYYFSAKSNNILYFNGSNILSSNGGIYQDYIVIRSSGSAIRQLLFNPNATFTSTDLSTGTPGSGTKFTLYYGNKNLAVDLETKANKCTMSDGSSVETSILPSTCSVTALSNVSITSARSNVFKVGKVCFVKLWVTVSSPVSDIATLSGITMKNNYELFSASDVSNNSNNVKVWSRIGSNGNTIQLYTVDNSAVPAGTYFINGTIELS